MALYKAELSAHFGVASKWLSDTIWGHVAIQILSDEKLQGSFQSLLDLTVDREPPFLVSAGFPRGYLPLPALDGTKEGRTGELKKLRKMRYVAADLFRELNSNGWSAAELLERLGKSPELFLRESMPSFARVDGVGPKTTREASTEHTAVNRFTGAALEGQLFWRKEALYPAGIDIYFEILRQDEGWEDVLAAALARLEMVGYGAKVSSGKGQVSIGSLTEVSREMFGEEPAPDRHMSLSSFCPRKGQISDWLAPDVIVKRGKLGAVVTPPKAAAETHRRPWKLPLLMLAPGTTYKSNTQAVVGDGLRDIAPALPEAVQYAYAMPVGIKTDG